MTSGDRPIGRPIVEHLFYLVNVIATHQAVAIVLLGSAPSMLVTSLTQSSLAT